MKNKLAIILAIVLLTSLNNLTGQDIPVPGDIIITEIMQNPKSVSDSKGEWVEFFNASNKIIDLNNWIIRDDGSNSHTISKDGGLIINPGDYLVLGNNDDISENGGILIDYKYSSFTLGNSEDEIILLNEDESVLVDQVKYTGNDGWPDPDGASMELILQYFNFQDNDNGNNWQEATVIYGDGDFGTPGEVNSGNSNEIEITLQPVDQTLCEGETLILQIRAGGVDSIIYKWKKDGVEIDGESGPDLLYNYSNLEQSGEYQCIISCNGVYCESRIAYVEIYPLPFPQLGNDSIFTSQPDTIVLDPGDFYNYLWQDGQTNKTYNVTNYGWYIVEVSNQNCSTKDSVFISPILAYHNISIKEDLKIFPNPAGSSIKIILPANYGNEVYIRILSYSGAKVSDVRHFSNTNEIYLDINNLRPGPYFINVSDNKNIYLTRKFIKL
ncbi:lamin tail domain-containing protein [Bacteroidota bacterium]